MKLPFVRLRPFVQMRMTRQLLPEMPWLGYCEVFRSGACAQSALLAFRGHRTCTSGLMRVFGALNAFGPCARLRAVLYHVPQWVRLRLSGDAT